ncbi:MAG TPA: primosomal protein N' [Chitinophagaceae bacterium]|nr:primosomal protein N' [Chitinophagaceae bacterium]
MYADIIIPLALPKTYTWSIPAHLQESVQPGCRVEVELGKNKRYAGIVKKLHHQKPPELEAKDILNVLDTTPVVHELQLKLWEWVAQYYMCSEGEVMAAALPAHFKLSSETIIVYNDEYGDDFSALDHDEYLVAEALLIKKELKVPEVQQILDSSNVYPIIKKLIEKKVCFVWESLKETYKPKKETFVLLDPKYNDEAQLEELVNNWARAPKQLELLLSYIHLSKAEGEVTKSELLKKSGASDAQLKGLTEKGVLLLQNRRVDRMSYAPRNVNIGFTLTDAQREALDQVQASFNTHAVCLLHGVTSSGKTLLYIKIIEQYIQQRKQVLYLLPEIALTSQIIRRLQQHFGGYIGIYHSKFNQNERVEIWNKIRTGELAIILGARSSLFLPFHNLGLVIVDEEHDASYKQQDPAPRYHARDAAVYYASLCNAKVLLGSATPSVETYHNAITGKYGLVELTERYAGLEMPAIEIIDTKKIISKERTKVIVTPQLQESINQTIQQQKQVILFQNRRGYSPYQVCETCGWIPKCKYCDVSLNFHKITNKLHCHYCGTTYPPVQTCAQCHNYKFIQRNFGTERIEEELEETFPGARIARMDVDSLRGKHAHDQLIQLFEQNRVDMLVGTQMVVKGLDFENVELVGILDADSLLNFPDFRVYERAFQLMEQVSGRAGRKDKQGRVMIQAANTTHPVLQFVQQHNYKLFFEFEIEYRQQYGYPPYARLILVSFRHKMKDIVQDAAVTFAGLLEKDFGNYIVGPARPAVGRVRNQYLMDLLLKLPKDTGLITRAKQAIRQGAIALYNNKRFKSVVVIPDVDPV